MAEFAANANVSTSMKMSPFFANYRFHPRMSFDPASKTPEPQSTREAVLRKKVKQMANHMEKLWNYLQDELTLLQENMTEFANRNRTIAPEYQVGNKV